MCAVSGRRFFFAHIFLDLIESIFQMADISELKELQKDLQKFYCTPQNGQEHFYRICEGDLCAVYYRLIWYRGRVKRIDYVNKLVGLVLVDIGLFITVPPHDICVITSYFASIGPLSFPCRLNRLNEYENEDEIDENAALEDKFIDICKRSGSIQVHYLTNEMPYIVQLLIGQYTRPNGKSDAYILSLSYAVLAIEKIRSDRTEWIASKVDGPRCRNSASGEKVEVVVTAVRSPTEIYVSTLRFNEEKRKLHSTIQRWAIEHQMQERRDNKWQIGDQCLVHVRRLREIEMWYRGRITGIVDEELHVFLRDYGDVVTVKAQKLMRSTDKLAQMCDGVVKCHLDGVNSWLPSSSIILRSTIGEAFASFAPRVDGSVPITLWRPTQVLPSGAILEWENLNRWLVTATVIEVTESYIQQTQEKFRGNVDWSKVKPLLDEDGTTTDPQLDWTSLDWDSITLDSISDDSNEVNIDYFEYDEGAGYFRMSEPIFYELNEWVDGAVEHWLPSVRSEQSTFSGTPIHVDHNCVLHIHDTYRAYLAQHLCEFISRAIENDENVFDPFAVNWTVGQTCFARYDEKFYRGTIQSINRSKSICMVRYVDYGNCDPCKFEDMRLATKCGHIPILVRKYCLDNVLPTVGGDRWPAATVTVLQNELLQQLCTIRVKESANHGDGILPCSITRIGDRVDIKTRLIEMDLCLEQRR